jgi:hypothetical protein
MEKEAKRTIWTGRSDDGTLTAVKSCGFLVCTKVNGKPGQFLVLGKIGSGGYDLPKGHREVYFSFLGLVLMSSIIQSIKFSLSGRRERLRNCLSRAFRRNWNRTEQGTFYFHSLLLGSLTR